MKKKLLVVSAAALFALAVFAGTVLATPQSGVATSTVAKSLFGDIDVNAHSAPPPPGAKKPPPGPGAVWRARLQTHGQTDAYVVENTFQPGGTTGWHSHPGPSLIFVVSGSISNYMGDDPTCTPHTYTAGQGFVDAGGSDVHMLRNDTNTTAETVAVQLLPTGAQRKIDVPTAPQDC
jgi:quercetin dioxygenase-like cupin family protein